MNEKNKLDEAKYFYSKMLSEQFSREAFTFNLSAFLSATRSVLQYALKEASQKSGGQSWYDTIMNTSPELKFFKDERDLNIHEKPTHPKANFTMHAGGGSYLLIFGTVKMTVFDKDGNIKQQSQSDPEIEPTQKAAFQDVVRDQKPNEVKYYFEAWSGNEDVLSLSKKCLESLEAVVEDGLKKGFISG